MTRCNMYARYSAVVLCSLAVLLSACGGGGSSGGSTSATGTLNLAVTDAPVDMADAVWVEFSGVEINPANGGRINITYAAPKRLNLLALTGGVAEILLDGEIVPAGQINWVRLKVNATEGGDPADDSYIVIGGVPYELRIPSGSQRGLQLNRPINVPANGVATFTVDFDLRKSVHERSGNVYMLRPTLRMVDNDRDGALTGSVDTSTISAVCTGGDKAAVYVFDGGGVTPDDVDGNNPEPVSTASVDWENADYNYTVAYLEAGTYTAAFTCDAGDDDPTIDDAGVAFTGTTTVTIDVGQTTTLNF